MYINNIILLVQVILFRLIAAGYIEKNNAIVPSENVEISLTMIEHYIFFGSDLLSGQGYHCYGRRILYFHIVTCM